ncbi:uncharacterized protein LOC119651860 [Hermetia illucens]|uniref:uncharacterized protein LOC119651860 n=1 Tax=Hermetia illucens TaxID=343691 RepID=UPI0018CC3910|nr:uncharacterized protein LOC119651860 [Hermetia illucens]
MYAIAQESGKKQFSVVGINQLRLVSNNVAAMSNNLKNWTIRDSLFFPLGLFNNASKNKTVFVTWSHDTIITSIFKKSGNSNSLKDTYKIHLPGTIRDIIVTDFNTLCLTRTGYVYYFSSCKSLRRLENLDGVRCITATASGFAIIKVTKENRIVLETYRDFTDIAEISRGRRSFDISFDDVNLLNNSWNDENFCILSIRINTENMRFLELVAKQSLSGTEMFLFTVNNSLFGLLGERSEDGSDFSIFVIHTLASEIASIRFISEPNLILIFMKCGVLEMIFYSKLYKSLDRKVYMTGADIISSTFAENCFFYSEDFRIVKCELTYNKLEHTIEVKKMEKAISGIVAMTWVSTTKKLICLSENNIFYRVKFDEAKEGASNDEFSELNHEKMKEIEAHFSRLVNLIEEPNRIRKLIRCESQKQELMSIYKRQDMYEDLIEARLSFYKDLPELQGLTIYPISEQVLTKNTYFALVELQIRTNPIFKSGLWRLCIELLGDRCIYKSIPVTPTMLEDPLTILLQTEKGKILILPQIRVTLTSLLNVGVDFMYISMPAKVRNTNIDKLFSSKLKTLVDPNRKTVDEKIAAHSRNNALPSTSSSLEFSSRIKTPLLVTIEEIYETFDTPTDQSTESLEHKFVIYILGEQVNIEYFELENIIEITCHDPGALYYTKRFLMEKLYNDTSSDEMFSVNNPLQALQKLRVELNAKKYGHLELESMGKTLKKVYTTLRKGILTRI